MIGKTKKENAGRATGGQKKTDLNIEKKDSRSIDEHDLRARLIKEKFIGLAILERARKKECARVANIKEGDANTSFFFILESMGGEEKCTSIASSLTSGGSPT
jgi:hypothetical protein